MTRPPEVIAASGEVKDERAAFEEYASAMSYASSLATALFKSLYAQESDYASGKVVWGLCDTLPGILTQIDNMVCGLVKPVSRVDEVEASGEAEKHAYPPLPTPARANGQQMSYDGHDKVFFDCYDSVQMRAYVDADRKERQLCNFCLSQAAKANALYEKSQELFARERGITKGLAAVLKDAAWRVDDIRDMLMKRNGRDESIYGCDEWSTPTVDLATAHKVITDALAKVQS